MLDFDNDGDIDLALSDEIADVVTLMQNANGPSPLCPPAPATCRTTVQAGKSSFTLKDKTPDKNDQLVWKWAGEITAKADYGNPVTTDDYALCLYDAGALVASATRRRRRHVRHEAVLEREADQLRLQGQGPRRRPARSRSTLKEGLVAGKAKITFKGKGGPLADAGARTRSRGRSPCASTAAATSCAGARTSARRS